MSRSLATKYRPRKFSHIIGQNDVRVIKTVVSNRDSLPPLLLFCGPSGVGKTTAARVVASYLNCTNIVNDEPCGRCDNCRAIAAGASVAVYELDSASHGTADKLRDLVVKSQLSSIGTRIFILDEAQAISGQGWNVLLKVLEEPPPNCLFLLLTSEPKKVPAKIRTRALKFTFRPVAPKKLREYIEGLCSHDKISIDSEDLDIIVDLAEGSVRDALSMLEQSAVVGAKASIVFANKDKSVEFILSLIDNDLIKSFLILDSWWDDSGDAGMIMSQIASCLEKVSFIKSGLDVYANGINVIKYKRIADGLTGDGLIKILNILSDWYLNTGSKAQLIMMTTKFSKALNGEVVAPIKKSPIVKEEANIDIKSRLEKL